MKFPFSATVTKPEETVAIINEFSREVQPGDTIALNGNLGAGKTFFAQKFCRLFGIEEVTSPTFSIVNEYESDNLRVYHFDFYRINRKEELYDIGIEEYFADDEAVKLIEWADMMRELIPEERYEVNITLKDDMTRTIRIDKYE